MPMLHLNKITFHQNIYNSSSQHFFLFIIGAFLLSFFRKLQLSLALFISVSMTDRKNFKITIENEETDGIEEIFFNNLSVSKKIKYLKH